MRLRYGVDQKAAGGYSQKPDERLREPDGEGVKVIGLIGRAGSGKTTIGKHLEEHFGFKRMAFADPLKQMLIKASICTHDEVYVQKTPESRRMLQLIGTEIFRKQIDPLFWVDKAIEAGWNYIEPLDDDAARIVFDDIRFPEEAEAIQSMFDGVLVKVERIDHVDATAGTTHDSESKIDCIPCDHVIRAESGDIQKLLLCIEEIIGERP